MTREEAINDLKDFIDTYITVHGEEDIIAVSLDNVDVEAFDMAIKALEQQPCEDSISRAEAQTEIEMNASRYAISKERGGMGQVEWSDQLIKVSDAVDIIRHLPPAQPKPKTGHWEMCEDADGIYGVCDICGTDADFTHYGKAYPYCPNCGARMESEVKE